MYLDSAYRPSMRKSILIRDPQTLLGFAYKHPDAVFLSRGGGFFCPFFACYHELVTVASSIPMVYMTLEDMAKKIKRERDQDSLFMLLACDNQPLGARGPRDCELFVYMTHPVLGSNVDGHEITTIDQAKDKCRSILNARSSS
jgi:hypothetical protein